MKTVPHSSITFHNNPVSLCPTQRYLGLVIDLKLTFNHHFKQILSKDNKSIGLLHKFQLIPSNSSLLTIYKTFICSQLDYSDVIYNQNYNSPFQEKLELIQCNVVLTIIGAIRGSCF